jgi:hypothetical protein
MTACRTTNSTRPPSGVAAFVELALCDDDAHARAHAPTRVRSRFGSCRTRRSARAPPSTAARCPSGIKQSTFAFGRAATVELCQRCAAVPGCFCRCSFKDNSTRPLPFSLQADPTKTSAIVLYGAPISTTPSVGLNFDGVIVLAADVRPCSCSLVLSRDMYGP